MDKEKILDGLLSGNSDRVNSIIDEAKDLEIEEKVELIEEVFDDVAELYESNDGYQRQSVVRFLGSIFAPQGSEEYFEKMRELYKKAIQDEDGRVRKSALKHIKGFALLYESVVGDIDEFLSGLEEVAGKIPEENSNEIKNVIVNLRTNSTPPSLKDSIQELVEFRKMQMGRKDE